MIRTKGLTSFKPASFAFALYASLYLLMLTFSSCNTTRYLKPNERLLVKSELKFKNGAKIADKTSIVASLNALEAQKVNEKLLFFIPKNWIYLSNSGAGDTTKIDGWLRSLGEKPTLYDEALTTNAAKEMENFLRFKKGFYEAKVDFIYEEKTDVVGYKNNNGNNVWTSNKSKVTYLIQLNQRYKVKTISYTSPDKRIEDFLESVKIKSFVKVGDDVDYNDFELEKNRITLELQNNGYAKFSNNFIEILGDSSKVDKSIEVIFDIKVPSQDSIHKRLTVGDINIYTDYFKDQNPTLLTSIKEGELNFFRQSEYFLVKPKLIANAVFIKPNELLRRDDRQKTFRKLNSLGTYRFVSIVPRSDENIDSIMHFDILLSPYDKKWIFDGALEVYYSTLGAARLFGTSVSTSLQNRNLFGGSERYTLKAELGTEVGINFSDTTSIFTQRTRNFTLQNTINIPSFQDFIGLGKLANKIGIIKNRFFTSFKEEATTNIDLGYNGLNIIRFYSVNSFNASFSFDYTSQKGNRYSFRPLGFNFDKYTVDTTAITNELIRKSFKDVLSTGFLFRDISYIYNRPKSSRGNSFLIINRLELSGLEVYLANQLYNTIASSNDIWRIQAGNSIDFAKYIRYEFDGRYYKELNKTDGFASRFNFGIIVPYGDAQTTPFIRQFGVGGPSSLRAWNVRQPGPGGYLDEAQLDNNTLIYVNQGDIKLELNAEYRFKMIYIFDGALFVDAGNIWALKADASRPGANFKTSEFVSQMAVGVGYGLRLNLDFFNIRFDFGYKVRNPYVNPNSGRNWYTFKEVRNQGLGNVQVAVNYPF